MLIMMVFIFGIIMFGDFNMAIYIPDIPQGQQQINQTTSGIQGNFQYIYDLININHVPFNTLDDFGKHTFINYVQQTVPPTTNTTEMAMFTMLSLTTNKLELFARYPNNGTVIQLTGSGSNQNNINNPVGGTYLAGYNPDGYQYGPGMWQYFPGGGFMLFGTISTAYAGVGNGSTITAKFPIANGIPTFSQTPFNIQIWDANGNPYSSSDSFGFYSCDVVDTTKFTIYNKIKSSGWSASWMVIGV